MSPLKIITMIIMSGIIIALGMTVLVPTIDDESLGRISVVSDIS
jgi:hypothetical protein